MVISIIIEGGVLANDNISAITMNNVESLRQSFYRIFNGILQEDEDISIKIIPQASYKQAIKSYLVATEDTFLLIDLDMPKQQKAQWFDNLATLPNKPITIPDERKENIYFMIQEMEAWILKQPEAIYKWAIEYNHYLTKRTDNLAEHTMLNTMLTTSKAVSTASAIFSILLILSFSIESVFISMAAKVWLS